MRNFFSFFVLIFFLIVVSNVYADCQVKTGDGSQHFREILSNCRRPNGGALCDNCDPGNIFNCTVQHLPGECGGESQSPIACGEKCDNICTQDNGGECVTGTCKVGSGADACAPTPPSGCSFVDVACNLSPCAPGQMKQHDENNSCADRCVNRIQCNGTPVPSPSSTPTPTNTPTPTPTPVYSCRRCSSNFGCQMVAYQSLDQYCGVPISGTQVYTPDCTCAPLASGDNSACYTNSCFGKVSGKVVDILASPTPQLNPPGNPFCQPSVWTGINGVQIGIHDAQTGNLVTGPNITPVVATSYLYGSDGGFEFANIPAGSYFICKETEMIPPGNPPPAIRYSVCTSNPYSYDPLRCITVTKTNSNTVSGLKFVYGQPTSTPQPPSPTPHNTPTIPPPTLTPGGPTPTPAAWIQLNGTSFQSYASVSNVIPAAPLNYDTSAPEQPYFIIKNSVGGGPIGNVIVREPGVVTGPIYLGVNTNIKTSEKKWSNTSYSPVPLSISDFVSYTKAKKDYVSPTDPKSYQSGKVNIFDVNGDITFNGDINTDAKAGETPGTLLIVEGHNVIISGDFNTTKEPIAIMVTKDKNGNGGTLTIDPSVREANGVFIADKVVLQSSSGGLRIEGNLVTSLLQNGRTQSNNNIPSLYIVSSINMYMSLLPVLSKNTYEWTQLQ